MDLSKSPEKDLCEKIAADARARWLAENREALEAHDHFVERHGLWSDGLRQF